VLGVDVSTPFKYENESFHFEGRTGEIYMVIGFTLSLLPICLLVKPTLRASKIAIVVAKKLDVPYLGGRIPSRLSMSLKLKSKSRIN